MARLSDDSFKKREKSTGRGREKSKIIPLYRDTNMGY